MLRIGVLSDTHMSRCTDLFQRQIEFAFADCQAVIHAGDLTDKSILEAFAGREINAVHGNSCNAATQAILPSSKTVTFENFSIGICHGTGNKPTIEDRLLLMFPSVDCIVYGHTHIPLKKKIGSILLLNPGSFSGTGLHGAAGTYAVITIDRHVLSASIHELPPSL